jgi:hypothetical protein
MQHPKNRWNHRKSAETWIQGLSEIKKIVKLLVNLRLPSMLQVTQSWADAQYTLDIAHEVSCLGKLQRINAMWNGKSNMKTTLAAHFPTTWMMLGAPAGNGTMKLHFTTWKVLHYPHQSAQWWSTSIQPTP